MPPVPGSAPMTAPPRMWAVVGIEKRASVNSACRGRRPSPRGRRSGSSLELRSGSLRRGPRELGPRAVEVGGAADRADADETPLARVTKGEAALVLVGLERLVVPRASEAHVLQRQPVGEVGPEVRGL